MRFTPKEQKVISMYESGIGFREIHLKTGVCQADALLIVGRYRRSKRELGFGCQECPWKLNGNNICVLPKCFLQNPPAVVK